MEAFTFPSEIVLYLNALWASQPAEEARQGAVEHLRGTAAWLKEQTHLLVGPEEELAASQLRTLGRELGLAIGSLQAGRYSALEQLCCDYSLALNTFTRLRSRLRFVDFCEIDVLMQWAVAVSQRRAPRSALTAPLLEASELMERLGREIEACLPGLPHPVQQALQNGLRLVTQGLDDLGTGAEEMRRALLLLRKGCHLLGYFVRWRWQQTGWSSPFADNPVWKRLNRLAFEVERGASLEPALPQLRQLAQEDRDTRLLPRQQAESLWREWNLRLHCVRPEALDDLLQLVEEMHEQTLDVSAGFATFLENVMLAASGVWRGTLPDSLLARELWSLFPRALDSVQDGLNAVRYYLEQGDREELRAALEILVHCAQENRRPQVVLSGLRCRCCQQYFNPEDANDRCLGQGVHQYLQVCA